MSNSEKMPAEQANTIAQSFIAHIDDLPAEIMIAGSLRRKKQMVGDIELVVVPANPGQFLARLDKLVITGAAKKAVYSNGTHRWGEKYRGLVYEGARIEVFLADADNRGFIYWLRTGPGDAGTFVMQQMIFKKFPYRCIGGYLVDGEDGARLSVPDESEWFRLLSMPYVAPPMRTLDLYMQTRVAPVTERHYAALQPVDKPVQSTLF